MPLRPVRKRPLVAAYRNAVDGALAGVEIAGFSIESTPGLYKFTAIDGGVGYKPAGNHFCLSHLDRYRKRHHVGVRSVTPQDRVFIVGPLESC